MKKLVPMAMAILFSLPFLAGCSHHPATAATPAGVSAQKADLTSRVDMASRDLTALINAPDTEIPQTIMAKAKCVAVIPDMVKGGFVFGGKHGRGLGTCRSANGGWTAPAPIALSGGSWGAQIGVQQADIVLLFMNNHALQDLLSNKVKLGVNASVAAGPVGRHAQAATDIEMKSEILSYSRTRGLFAGLDLSGAKVSQDMDTTVAMYGKSVPYNEILTGRVRTPQVAERFVNTVNKDFATAVAQEG